MIVFESVTTRDKILDAAVFLFSEKGYCRVSMRDIAKEVGIKAASIYNHFSSKSDILKNLFELYAAQRGKYAPTLDELLLLTEAAPSATVLSKLVCHYPPGIDDRMGRILIIAGQELCSNADGERFLREHLYDATLDILVPVLNRLIELKKIEPINVWEFSLLLTYFDISAALLNHSSMRSGLEQWQSCLSLLFSLVRSKDVA